MDPNTALTYAFVRLPETDWTLSRLLVAKQEFRRLGLQWDSAMTHNEAVSRVARETTARLSNAF
jgi:hypothetical protein